MTFRRAIFVQCPVLSVYKKRLFYDPVSKSIPPVLCQLAVRSAPTLPYVRRVCYIYATCWVSLPESCCVCSIYEEDSNYVGKAKWRSRMPVRINGHGVEIDSCTYALFSGSVHYWRLERERWPGILDLVREMGFRFICADIPWSVHEIRKGEFDFGERDPAKDVGAFIDLCADKGLYVLARPCPRINAEITGAGYPDRLFGQDSMIARTAEDTPAIVPAPPRFFPAISYAADSFYEEVSVFFDALCPILSPRLHPGGPVVGVQPDSGMSFFSRTSPFDLDYSEASIALYRRYLQGKYTGIDDLNAAYDTDHFDFADVSPPRRFEADSAYDLPYYLDWMEYREFYIYHGIHRIARMLRERDITGVFYFHNFPTAYPTTPYHIPKIETCVDVAGIDLWRGGADYGSVKTGARFLAGTSRLPFVPEFRAGGRPWDKPMSQRDRELAARAALMNGVKAANFHMIVERERWCGAPVTRDGRKRGEYFNFYCRLNRFIEKMDFNEYDMRSDVLLLSMRDYERLERLGSYLSPLPPQEPGAAMPHDWFVARRIFGGFSDPIGAVYKRQWRAFRMGFTQAGFPVTLADSAVEQETLQKYKIVIAPSFEFMNIALQRRLLVYAFKGGTLVMGPRMPVCDEFMRRDSRFSSHSQKPVERIDRMNIGPLVVENADIFKTDRVFIEESGKVCAYISPTERGSIIHLGFIFQDYTGIEQSPTVAGLMMKIAAAAGVRPLYKPSDPLVETVAHDRGADRLVFVANPTDEPRNVRVEMGRRETLVDVDTAEKYIFDGEKINLPEQSIKIFRSETG